jgi:cell division inhibitor SepF
MGTLRKMGAFLGLVPDDQRYLGEGEQVHPGYSDGPGAADGYRESYGSSDYPAQEYAADGYDGDAYDGDYAGSGVSAEYRAGYDNDGYRTDYADEGSDLREPAYAGYQHSSADGDGDVSIEPEPAYAGVAVDAMPAGRPEPVKAARGGGRGARGHRGRSADSDFHTQGALAVQPQAVQLESPVEASTGKPATVKLSGFGDARQVGETYRDGQAVILDMTDLTDSEARRMVDFAAGLAFAVHGSIDKVTTKVFMLHQPTGDAAL